MRPRRDSDDGGNVDRSVDGHRRRVDVKRPGSKGLTRLAANRDDRVGRARRHRDRQLADARHEPRPARRSTGGGLAEPVRRPDLGHRRRPRHDRFGRARHRERPPPHLRLPRQPSERRPVVPAGVPQREARRHVRGLRPDRPRLRIEDRQRHPHGDRIFLHRGVHAGGRDEPRPLRERCRHRGPPIEERLHDAPPQRPGRRRAERLRRMKPRARRPRRERHRRRDRRRERPQHGLRPPIRGARGRLLELAKRLGVPRARRRRERAEHLVLRGQRSEVRGIAPFQEQPLGQRRPVLVRVHPDRRLAELHVRANRTARGHQQAHAQRRRSPRGPRELDRPHRHPRRRKHHAGRPHATGDLEPEHVRLRRCDLEIRAGHHRAAHRANRGVERAAARGDGAPPRHGERRPREHEGRDRPLGHALLHQRERQPRPARARGRAAPQRVAHRREEAQRGRHRLGRGRGGRGSRPARPLHGVLLEPLPPEQIHFGLGDLRPQPRGHPGAHHHRRRRSPVRDEKRPPTRDRLGGDPRDRRGRIRVPRRDAELEILHLRRARHAHALPGAGLDQQQAARLDPDVLIARGGRRRPARGERLDLRGRRPREPRRHRGRAPREGDDREQKRDERRSRSHRRAGNPEKERLTAPVPELRTWS